MKAEERSFRKDEVIFREGDAGEAIYVVMEGRVEVLKAGPDGPVVIALPGPGEMFGEMGVLDDGPRNTTAVAAADSVLRTVPKKDFRAWIKQDPEASARVIKLLVDRLRQADDVIAQHRTVQFKAGRTRGSRLLDGLLAWLKSRRSASPATQKYQAEESLPAFTVGIAAINNDVEGAWTRALADLFEGRQGLTARVLTTPLKIETSPDQVNAAVLKARQLIAQDDQIDLVVWGDVHADGFTLMFTSASQIDDERPGVFGPFLALELAGTLEPPVGDILALATLAAMEPATDGQRALQHQALPAALEAMGGFLGSVPVAWNLEQQRTALVCYGHAAATIAGWDGNAEWYDHAAEAYRAAINRLPQGEHGLDQAMARKYLGMVMAAAGERRQDMALIEQAAGEFRTAAECLVKGIYPQEWAAAHNRLGLTLFKLDHLTSHPDLLKEALGAFQSALQVYTRADAPLRFSDTMANLAQVLLVYGDQMKNAEVLERAVDAARAALDNRSRERSPAPWAAGQNALGTALYLLDKHNKSALHLDEARTALTAAAETYRALGAVPRAKVAEKNLVHLEKLAKSQGGRRVAKPEWAEDKPE